MAKRRLKNFDFPDEIADLLERTAEEEGPKITQKAVLLASFELLMEIPQSERSARIEAAFFGKKYHGPTCITKGAAKRTA